MKTKYWVVLFGVLLAACVGMSFWLLGPGKPSRQAEVWSDGKLKKSDYRLFNIRTTDGADDYGSMREALTRRLSHIGDGSQSLGTMPDLILVDGGDAHVGVAKSVLESLSVEIPVFGMVKDDFHKTRALTDGKNEISIAKEFDMYAFIYNLQEEAHRFAVKSSGKGKIRTMTHSSLEKIEGIGPAKARALLAVMPLAANTALTKAMSELRMKAAEGVNLALGMNVTATSSYEEGNYFLARFLTDGVYEPFEDNPHIGWSVNPFDVLGQNTPVDIIVDLEMTYLIDAVVVRPPWYIDGGSFPQSYTVEVSTDKKTWVKIGEAEDLVLTETLDQSYTADSVEARYVRIHITRHSDLVDATGCYLSQIGEIEVYGKDAPPESGTDPVEPDTSEPDTDPVTEPTDHPTEAPTRSPDAPAEDPTETPDVIDEGKKGCGSALVGAAVTLSAMAAAVALTKRKERET